MRISSLILSVVFAIACGGNTKKTGSGSPPSGGEPPAPPDTSTAAGPPATTGGGAMVPPMGGSGMSGMQPLITRASVSVCPTGPDSACEVDANCPNGQVCFCHSSTPGSVCVPSDCSTDSDCSAGPCAYTGVTDGDDCSSRREEFRCVTAADECLTYTDCSKSSVPTSVCLFDSKLGHRVCRNIECGG